MKTIQLVVKFIACALLCALSAEAKEKPMKVYLLAGQSNMTGIVSEHTLEHIKMFPDTAREFADLFDEEGNPVVLDEVYVSQWMGKDSGKLAPRYGGGKGVRMGPDYAFGVYMHKQLNEPFLIIKTSLGGSSLSYRFRSPSAGTWTPPPGHPDLIKKEKVKPPVLPIPGKLDLADDWTPEKPYELRRRHLGLVGFKGAEIRGVNGVYPIYLLSAPKQTFKGAPFQKGDLILGVDGSGLREDPIQQWRDAFYGSSTIDGDWMVQITRWRAGKIETFDFDICDSIEGGRAGLPKQIEALKKEALEEEENRGFCYRDMITHVKKVLADGKAHHPAYDPEAGFELAGFVWFQGYNDMIDEGLYPNRDKPRGYEQYTWLLEHLIRDLRKDLDAPELPVVIGVMGMGGISTAPDDYMTHFQQAQAAPAENPEFKGTVVAVQAGKYWDHDLAALDHKSREIMQKMRDFKYEDGLEGDALKKAYNEYRARHITAEEEHLLRTATSNQDFHYLGSAKIMCGIGKAFAEAMVEIQKK